MTTIEISKGRTCWIYWDSNVRKAKILAVISQLGMSIVRFRIGPPLIGLVYVETHAEFWKRVVKE